MKNAAVATAQLDCHKVTFSSCTNLKMTDTCDKELFRMD